MTVGLRLFLLFLLVGLSRPALAGERVLEDFNGPIRRISKAPGDLSFLGPTGRPFGAWNKDPEDRTQVCEVDFSEDDALGRGSSVRLFYDVDSPYPAFNGFYLKLNGEDFSAYDTLHFYLKGDAKKGFPKRVKIELKNGHEAHRLQREALGWDHEPYLGAFTFPLMVEGITQAWQKFSVPFADFVRFRDRTDMHEWVLIFDDINSDPKSGVLYLDRISVSSTAASG